jgi:hypothetical protein
MANFEFSAKIHAAGVGVRRSGGISTVTAL